MKLSTFWFVGTMTFLLLDSSSFALAAKKIKNKCDAIGGEGKGKIKKLACKENEECEVKNNKCKNAKPAAKKIRNKCDAIGEGKGKIKKSACKENEECEVKNNKCMNADTTIHWPSEAYSSFGSNRNIYNGTTLDLVSGSTLSSGRPTTTKEAAANGWKPLQKECVPYLGYPWAFDGKITDGAPVTMYYSKKTKKNDGVLTGLAVHYYDNAAPDEMIGSIFLEGDDYDTLQVAFHDKNTDVCGGGSVFSNEPYIALLLADGKRRKSFPMTEDAAIASGEWAKGTCLNGMGVHYWNDIEYGSNLSFEAKNLYPMAPMYNQKDGSLNGIMFVAPKLMHTWDTEICGLPPKSKLTQECRMTTNFWDIGPGQVQKQTDPEVPLSMCNNFCGDCPTLLSGATDVFDTMHWFFVKGGEATTCALDFQESC